MERKREALHSNAYDNCKVYHPNGKLMFYCSLKRLNWYLNKDLAEKIDDTSIKLTFTPKGEGEPEYLLYPRESKCVVCGTEKNLTKHHVIPYRYRKLFPLKYKDKNSYDVVVMCRDHHNEYEIYADELKMMLEEKYSKGTKEYNLDLKRANSIYSLLKRDDTEIPDERISELEEILFDMCFKYNWDLNELEDLSPINPGESIVEKVGVEELILMWKDHFINTIDTPYLPKTWDKDFVRTI